VDDFNVTLFFIESHLIMLRRIYKQVMLVQSLLLVVNRRGDN